MATNSDEIKRGRTDGFDGVEGEETRRRLHLMLKKNLVKGDWRKERLIRISCTILLQKWSYMDKHFIRKTLYPWGMKKFGCSILSDVKCFASYDVIPKDVRCGLGLSFDKDMSKEDLKKAFSPVRGKLKIEVTCEDETIRPKGEFTMLYCLLCCNKDGALGEIFKKKRGIYKYFN